MSPLELLKIFPKNRIQHIKQKKILKRKLTMIRSIFYFLSSNKIIIYITQKTVRINILVNCNIDKIEGNI